MKLAATDVGVKLASRMVLSKVSVEIRPAEVTAVLGPNGAGKSTLLKVLAGLLDPLHGSVTIDDKPLDAIAPNERARAIGYLPQSRTVHWPLTVARTVSLGRAPYLAATATDKAGDRVGDKVADKVVIDEAMREMDVIAFRDRIVTELSGGELARVLMARVLAQQTPILLVDEPTAGLDPAHQIGLLDRLRTLAGNGRTVVIAMHDLSLAARYCQRIIMLKAGTVVGNGTPDDVLTERLLAETFGIRAKLVRLEGIPVVLPSGLC